MDELPLAALNARPTLGRVDVRATTLAIFVGVGAVFALREAASLIAPLLVSVLLAYALEPAVALLERCRVHRTLAILLVFALLLDGVIAAGTLPRQQAVGFLAALPPPPATLHPSPHPPLPPPPPAHA